MKLIGVDVGEKRVGIAVCDPAETIAQPLTTIEIGPSDDAVEKVIRTAEEAGAEGFAVGLPISLSGAETDQTKIARDFAEELKRRSGLDVELIDERLSSRGAERTIASTRTGGRKKARRPDKGAIDRIAAAVILQSCIDSRRTRRAQAEKDQD